ncbi:MAG: primosomal protein N' [Betaproteobacteria bacterium]|nr:primosomal protein N' [Betaproteobacteria bacterium]
MTILQVALDVPVARLFDYAADVGDAVGKRVLVPFGRRELVGVVMSCSPASEVPAEQLRAVTRILPGSALPGEWLQLVGFCSRYYHHPAGEVAALALPPGLRRGEALPRPAPPGAWIPTPAGIEAAPSLGARSLERRLMEGARQAGTLDRPTVAAMSARARAAVRVLVERGWLEPVEAVPDLAPVGALPLHDAQAGAVSAIAAALGRFDTFLLHGVTGSGKTEVYLHAIAAALARGGQALMLVPEIALTPQLEGRVAGRFPGARLVSLHSGMGEAARSRGFLQAKAGQADIVLGTRLAVFTPLPRLALVVVDEEHDASFRQQDGMRYSARDVAVLRARQRGVPVVLGSATPSLESFHHARSGRYRLLKLEQRAVAASLPTVRCIDLRGARLHEGLAPALVEAIEARLARGEQSLVFLNRRGYAPVLACPACGWVSGCDHCSANMVLHLADRLLRCHHCGVQHPIPRACPTCGNQDIQPFGRGTQRLEDALQALFPAARVLRVDRDSAATAQRWQVLCARIHAGEADILVGTQMLAKGHDFPRLTLVGVLNADASLFASDFRAGERLFAQLMQVGGRSGRAELPGEVLIQTSYPEHPLYQALRQHDFDRYAGVLLEERRNAGFPPFAFQALLRAEAPQMAQALAFLGEALKVAGALGHDAVTTYEAVPMRLARVAGLERARLLVEARRRPALHAFLDAWLERIRGQRVPRGLRWHVEVDPGEL